MRTVPRGIASGAFSAVSLDGHRWSDPWVYAGFGVGFDVHAPPACLSQKQVRHFALQHGGYRESAPRSFDEQDESPKPKIRDWSGLWLPTLLERVVNSAHDPGEAVRSQHDNQSCFRMTDLIRRQHV